MKQRETADVLENVRIAEDIFSLRLHAPKIAETSSAGQFVMIYCRDQSRLLPRPISVCEADAGKGELRLVFRIAGAGTKEFSTLKSGESIVLAGPLGNGFPKEHSYGKHVLLFGGGIGIPPMLQLAKDLEGRAQARAVLGFRDEQYLTEDFERHCAVSVATEDGSAGTKGNVIDAVRAEGLDADVFYACGPSPMLRAVSALAQERGAECWLSMEEKMACGIGACLSCVCGTREVDAHSQVRNRRVCTEGPVFRSTEIEL